MAARRATGGASSTPPGALGGHLQADAPHHPGCLGATGIQIEPAVEPPESAAIR
jgi:hypothetical protein